MNAPNPPVSHGKREAIAAQLGASMLLIERLRQIDQKGYKPENDDRYFLGELANAAACYAYSAAKLLAGEKPEDLAPPAFWPWPKECYKPHSPRRDLVRAGALILAELERLARAEAEAAARRARGEGAQEQAHG